jgi:hypothetical protein
MEPCLAFTDHGETMPSSDGELIGFHEKISDCARHLHLVVLLEFFSKTPFSCVVASDLHLRCRQVSEAISSRLRLTRAKSEIASSGKALLAKTHFVFEMISNLVPSNTSVDSSLPLY